MCVFGYIRLARSLSGPISQPCINLKCLRFNSIQRIRLKITGNRFITEYSDALNIRPRHMHRASTSISTYLQRSSQHTCRRHIQISPLVSEISAARSGVQGDLESANTIVREIPCYEDRAIFHGEASAFFRDCFAPIFPVQHWIIRDSWAGAISEHLGW